jgi:N-acetylated-alpha-linked acidic dipeptidase
MVAYFNTDTGASGPSFRASAVPSLKPFLRSITRAVPSPAGGTVHEQWRASGNSIRDPGSGEHEPQLGNLGSGSDFTALLDHAGVPATDVRSTGNYGVYHSVFDNYDWFRKFGDPGFKYVQQLARVFGLQVLRMAEAEVLPHDYEAYGAEIVTYIEAAQKRARNKLKGKAPEFHNALEAALRLQKAGAAANADRRKLLNSPDPSAAQALNAALRLAERALLLPDGLPRRPYFKHAIYAPTDLRGYAASVIPGVNEAIQRGEPAETAQQLQELADVLSRAAALLEQATRALNEAPAPAPYHQ